MKNFTIAVFLLMSAMQVSAATLSGKVMRVDYADRLVVWSAGQSVQEVQLLGVEAPPPHHPYARKAQHHLTSMVAGRFVVVNFQPSRRRPVLGKVLYGGADVNLRQIQAGLAVHNRDHMLDQTPADRETYARTEAEAREAGRGIWAR